MKRPRKVGLKEVEATGEERVDRKASGQIIIFNDFNTSSQRLIKNTRFETPEGLIYRVDKSIVVPGQTTNEDGEVIPGSIEVTVYADTSGDEYNIGLTDFTIPGFKGDPRFFKFYARSKTPIKGGFSGIEKTVAPGELSAARSEIHQSLEEEVLAEVKSEKPDGFVLFDDAYLIESTSLPNADAGSGGNVLVREEAVFYGFLFNELEFAKHVALNTVGSYEGEDVEIVGIENLEFKIVDKSLLIPASAEAFDFTLSGSGKIVWLFDAERLKEDMAGKHRRDTQTVLSGYPAIEKAEITIRPFWKRSFPDNPDKITVERIIE